MSDTTFGLFPLHGFDDWEDVQKRFAPEDRKASPVPACPEHLIFGAYETPSYDGYAIVIFWAKDKYWLVEGSHCSCHGLEGQWQPEPYETAELLKACLTRSCNSAWSAHREAIFQAIDLHEQRIKK